MKLEPDFAYQPTPPAPTPSPSPASPPSVEPGLGILISLVGKWAGTGLNLIWRPQQPDSGSDHFLEINRTEDSIEFDGIPGGIPNRGLLQADLTMSGIRYVQQVSDSNLDAGLHVEPGLWLSIPASTNPPLPATIARLATIPHGTTVLAQGIEEPATSGPPVIPPVSITPFQIGNPGASQSFAEQTLATDTNFRTSGAGLAGVTQEMLDDPNSVLRTALDGLSIASAVTLRVSTDDTAPVLGGGVANTAFLQGDPASGPNAVAQRMDATFWLQTSQGSSKPDVLQYSQTVLLNFNGLTWPHVSVGTLRRSA